MILGEVPSLILSSYAAKALPSFFLTLQIATAPSAVIKSLPDVTSWARICQSGNSSVEGNSQVQIATSLNGSHVETNTGPPSIVSIPALLHSRLVFHISAPSSDRPSVESKANCSSV